MKINTSFQKRNYGIIISMEYSKCTKSKVLRFLSLYENPAFCPQPEAEEKSEFLLLCCWLPTVISMETYQICKNKLSALISSPPNGWNLPCFNLANIHFQRKRAENWHHRLKGKQIYFTLAIYCWPRMGVIAFEFPFNFRQSRLEEKVSEL